MFLSLSVYRKSTSNAQTVQRFLLNPQFLPMRCVSTTVENVNGCCVGSFHTRRRLPLRHSPSLLWLLDWHRHCQEGWAGLSIQGIRRYTEPKVILKWRGIGKEGNTDSVAFRSGRLPSSNSKCPWHNTSSPFRRIQCHLCSMWLSRSKLKISRLCNKGKLMLTTCSLLRTLQASNWF